LASKAWKPADELNFILTQKEHYVLLIQRPGQITRHYGKHFHCVITAIDPILNPTGLSLSIGRRDKYLKDHYLYCSASKERLSKTKAQGYIQVSRKLYLKQNITNADKRELGKEFLDRKERARKRTPKKKGRIPKKKYPLRSFFCCKNIIQLKSFFSLLIPLTSIFIILRRVIVKRRLRQRKTMKQRKTRK
jgi:hypothetical protein